MKRTNKLLLTMGTAAAIVAPVASVVACGTNKKSEESREVKALRKQIKDLYDQLDHAKNSQSLVPTELENQRIFALTSKINTLTKLLEDLGYKIKADVSDFGDVSTDLTETNITKISDEINRINDIKYKLKAAMEDAVSNEQTKFYYPQYLKAIKNIEKLTILKNNLENPNSHTDIDTTATNKATKYDIDPSIIDLFTNYMKPLFEGGSEITSYETFKNSKTASIAKVGQLINVDPSKDSDSGYTPYSFDEGKVIDGDPLPNVGFGEQSFDSESGLVPHIDIAYDSAKGTDFSNFKDLFTGNGPFGFAMKDLANALKGNSGAQTLNLKMGGFANPNLKLFPYVYKDTKNPDFIHFALFAYKAGADRYKNLRPFSEFKNEYDGSDVIKRGVKKLSDAVGRDLSIESNYYTTDDDFAKIMKNIYYAPKRDEMQFINSHISDKDRISLYEQLFNGGGFNVMASGRIFGMTKLEDLYSGVNGEYLPKVSLKGTFVSDTLRLNKGEVPAYQQQTLADAKNAEKKYEDAEKFHMAGSYLTQRTPGRYMPSLAQNSLDYSTGLLYDLGGQVQFERDADNKITGFKNTDYNSDASLGATNDLGRAMWAMSNRSMGSEPKYYMGLTSWPRSANGTARINPFLFGLKINYFTVRNQDNKNDLDLVFKASRNGVPLPTYKTVVPEGTMNWDQINEAVKDSPVFNEPEDSEVSKSDFEFIMTKVISKWIDSGSTVSKYILPSVSNLLIEGLKESPSINDIDKYYESIKDDDSVDLWRLKELVTNPDIDFMDVFMSESWDSQSRKTLYTRYGENLLNVIAKISKKRILENPEGVSQDVIDSLSNEFAGL